VTTAERDNILADWERSFQQLTASLPSVLSSLRLTARQRLNRRIPIWLGGPGKTDPLYEQRLLLRDLLRKFEFDPILSEDFDGATSGLDLAIDALNYTDFAIILAASVGASAEAIDLSRPRRDVPKPEQTTFVRGKLDVFIPDEYSNGYVYRVLRDEYNMIGKFSGFSLSNFQQFHSELPCKILQRAEQRRTSLYTDSQLHAGSPTATTKLASCGSAQVDAQLGVIQNRLMQAVSVNEEEKKYWLDIMQALGKLASDCLGDASLFKSQISEKEFQQKVKQFLQRNPAIAPALEEHPDIAGGETDLSYHKIRIELKVENDKAVLPESAVEQYSQQTAQYTTGSDRRMGILCILDGSGKDLAPGSVRNDILIEEVPPPQGGHYPLFLGVVITRGNLKRPSEHSK
jgi:hypothetical protein